VPYDSRCEVYISRLFPGETRSEWTRLFASSVDSRALPLSPSVSEGDGLNGHLSRCWSRPQIRATTSWFYIVSGRVEDTSGPVLSSFVQNWSLSMRTLPYLRLEAWLFVHSPSLSLSLFFFFSLLVAPSISFFCRKRERKSVLVIFIILSLKINTTILNDCIL